MTVRSNRVNVESLADHSETTGLHDGGIGLVKILPTVGSDSTCASAGQWLFAITAGMRNTVGILGTTMVRLIFQYLLIVDAYHARRRAAFALQHEQQFLAFVAGGDDMHLVHRARKIIDGLMPIKHGGELDHDEGSLDKQQVLQGQYIRRAVGNRIRA